MARERGLKMTPQRRAIVEYLQNAEHHPTLMEVMDSVNDLFPMTSRATVYNTVNWLKEAGMLREIFVAGATRLDPNCGRHHHFICRQCSRVEDIGFDLIDDPGICSMPSHHTIEDFEITIRGLCANCQKN